MNQPLFRRGTLIFCLWLAFALRVWGLPFGLPYEFHPDEGQYVTEALNWHLTGRLHTGTVNPPLFIYVLAAAFQPWLMITPFQPGDAWITTAYTYARLWSVVFGLLTAALLFAAGRRLHSTRLGLVALALYCGLFLPARESHYAVNDTLAAFLALLAIFAALGIFRRGRRSDYALAGLAVGLAAAAKLNVALVGLAPLVAHMLAVPAGQHRLRAIVGHRQVWIGFGLALLAFTLVSLPVWLDASRFVENIGKHLQFGSEGYKGLQMAPAGGWFYYLSVAGWGLGWLVLLAIIGGLGWVAARRFQPGYVAAVFPLALFLFMGAQKILFARFLLPAVAPLVLLAALGLMALATRRLQQRWLWPPLLALLLAQPLAYLIWFDHLLTRPDTRQLASEWLAAEFAPDTVLVKESYSVFPDKFFAPARWPFKSVQLDGRGPTRNDADYFVAHKTNLIAVSNFASARVRQEPAEEAARQQQLAVLAERATLLKEFSPYVRQPDWFYLDELYGPAGEAFQRVAPGPFIKIYRLPYENQPYSTQNPPISVPVNANFANKLLLLGYDLPTRRADLGGSIPLTLYWQAPARLTETLVIFDRLLDANQQSWGGYDRWPQETANTNLWQPGEVVVDTFNIPVAANAPAGIYTIDIGLYNHDDPAGTPLPLLHDDQLVAQASVRLGPLKIGGAPPGATTTLANPQTVTNAIFDSQIELLGFDLDNSTLNNQNINLTLYWQALAQTPVDWSIFVHVRDAAGQMVAQMDGPAGGGNYPASLWDAGETIIDTLAVPLPDNLPPGVYQLVVGLYNLTDGTRLAMVDTTDDGLVIELK